MQTLHYYRGMPDRSGLAKYLHLAQWHADPLETMGRGRDRDPTHWQRTHSVKEYKKLILDLLEDTDPRTFNRICLELTGTTADVWYEKAPDLALWELVKEDQLAWAPTGGLTFFTNTKFVKWPVP